MRTGLITIGEGITRVFERGDLPESFKLINRIGRIPAGTVIRWDQDRLVYVPDTSINYGVVFLASQVRQALHKLTPCPTQSELELLTHE